MACVPLLEVTAPGCLLVVCREACFSAVFANPVSRINRGLYSWHSPARIIFSDEHCVNVHIVLSKQFFFVSFLNGLHVAVEYFFCLLNFTLGH